MNKLLLVLLVSIHSLFPTPFIKAPAQQAPREIVIETPGLLFNPARFKVKPGELIKVTLKNTDEMSHDWVLTSPNQREAVATAALAMLTSNPNETNFIPSGRNVLQSIAMLKPGEEKSITFTAPTREGVYPYLCTYPGHGSIMFGAMYVSDFDMPPLELDVNIPEARRKSETVDHSMHNMGPKKLVTIYRTYMPESGPAGIAVGMPGGISYNWDAGVCRLRYVWTGGFINLNKNWMGNGRDLAVIEGDIYYREKIEAPIRIGTKTHIPKQQFKGYSLTNNYPTFKYMLDDVIVTERITPATEVEGIIRTITFTNLKKPLWFVKAADKKIPATGGKWAGDYLAVTPVAGKAKIVLTIAK